MCVRVGIVALKRMERFRCEFFHLKAIFIAVALSCAWKHRYNCVRVALFQNDVRDFFSNSLNMGIKRKDLTSNTMYHNKQIQDGHHHKMANCGCREFFYNKVYEKMFDLPEKSKFSAK